jgi:cephalosporin hydroxylase
MYKKGKLFLFNLIFILSLFLTILSVYIKAEETLSDQEIIKRFHEIYYNSEIWKQTKFLGIDSQQNPCDNWIMQEIIYEVKPDFIIETGTLMGGSALYYATILENVNKNGKVITIDMFPQIEEVSKHEVFKKRVEFISGDSTSPEVINLITKKVKNHKVLVTLDSNHLKEHVLKEINLYSKFVSLNSYIVVQDTNINGHPVLPNFGEGPMEAVEEFLKTNSNFEIDHSREKFFLTFYPSGYLKRIK